MKKLILVAVALAAILTGCSQQSMNSPSGIAYWVTTPDGGRVMCAEGGKGVLDCNWDAFNKAHP